MQRESCKKLKFTSQRIRRENLLARQKQARRDLTNHARFLAAKETEETTTTPRETRLQIRRAKYANQLMVPEWMIEIPEPLNGKDTDNGIGWFVLPRPEGKRVLVIASNGETIARIQSGTIYKRFQSELPNGSKKTMTSQEYYCILDCIYHEPDETFYVLDMMCWKGYLLYNCTTEFRFYWIRSKLEEIEVDKSTTSNAYRFLPIPYFDADEEGIKNAFCMPFSFLRDGMLFFLKLGQYELGLSPLVLVWKDEHSSRYFQYSNEFAVVLKLGEEGILETLEGNVLHQVSNEFLEEHQLKPDDLLRYSISGINISLDNKVELLELQFQKRCSVQRALPDSLSKIVFQFAGNPKRITIEDLVDSANTQVMKC